VSLASASGGQYVTVPNGVGGSVGSPSPTSYIEFCVTVPVAGNYQVLARTQAPNASDDSLWVTVDNQAPVAWGIPQSNVWTENAVSTLTGADAVLFPLTAGDHVIRLSLREDGTRVDTLRLVQFIPPTATPTVTPTPTPAPAACGASPQQAEDGTVAGNMEIVRNNGGIGNAYVVAPAGNGFNDEVFPNPHFVEVCLTVPATGRYLIEGRTRTPNNGDDSFYVSVDNDTPIVWSPGITSGFEYSAVRPLGQIDPNEYQLTAGNHVIRFYQREDGAQLDEVRLVRLDERMVTPGDDFKAFVNSGQPGDTFLLADGVYNVSKIQPQDGMTFRAQNPRNAIFDGQGVNSVLFNGTASNVTIEGFEIRNYNPGIYQAPISARVIDQNAANAFEDGANWVIRNNYIHDNDGAGINVGSGMLIEDNRISRNSHIGISGVAEEGFELTGLKIRNNEIDNNTDANPNFDFEFHEGGIKATYAIDMEVTGNNIRDNNGAGVYCDLFCENLLVDNNTITDNGGRQNAGGVFVEIADGATITNNTISGVDGFVEGQPLWGGVTVAESQNVLVQDNIIDMDGATGIMFRNGTTIQDNAGNLSREPLENVRFVNNTITATSGETRVGFAGGTDIPTGAVVLSGNDYIQDGGTIRFTLDGARSWSFWQNTLGYDTNGTFTP